MSSNNALRNDSDSDKKEEIMQEVSQRTQHAGITTPEERIARLAAARAIDSGLAPWTWRHGKCNHISCV